MKTWILAAAMVLGMSMSAQEKGPRPEPLKPEQRAELQVKKMTLALDLNDKQQKDLKELFIAKGKEREAARAQMKAKKEAGAKMTADERFAMQSKRLDEQIAMKKELKKILTADQYAKLEVMKKDRKHDFGKREKRHDKPGRR